MATEHAAARWTLGGREGHEAQFPPAPAGSRLFGPSAALGRHGRAGRAARARGRRAARRRAPGGGRGAVARGRAARRGRAAATAAARRGRATVLLRGAVEVGVPATALEDEAGAADDAAERVLGATGRALLGRRIADLLQHVDRLSTGTAGVFVDGH